MNFEGLMFVLLINICKLFRLCIALIKGTVNN